MGPPRGPKIGTEVRMYYRKPKAQGPFSSPKFDLLSRRNKIFESLNKINKQRQISAIDALRSARAIAFLWHERSAET